MNYRICAFAKAAQSVRVCQRAFDPQRLRLAIGQFRPAYPPGQRLRLQALRQGPFEHRLPDKARAAGNRQLHMSTR